MSDAIRMRIQDVVNMGGGGGSDEIWLPSVDEDGDLSWSKSSTSTPPETVNIKGPAGAAGQDGADGADGRGITSIVKTATSANVDTYTITYTDGTTQTYTVTNGLNGTDGEDGSDGVGIASVSVNSNNHLIVTKTDGTTQDAGEIDVAVPIDDSTPAYNKVYSSEKTTELVGSKLDASEVTISGGGDNLFNVNTSHEKWIPTANAGASYSDGQTSQGSSTTNLIAYTVGQKLKLNITTLPSYVRAYVYDTNQMYLDGVRDLTLDTDGYYYLQYTDTSKAVAYVCFVFNMSISNFEALVIMHYDEWGGRKAVVNDLYFSDENVDMAKDRLKISSDVLVGTKWAVAGDSFTAGDFTGTTAPTIPDGQYAGKNAVYPYLIATRCDIEIQDLSKNGRTLALPSGEGASYNSFINHYQSVAADADYLTMYFGINDSHQSIPIGTISDAVTSSFYGAWNVILTWLIANRPNLHIGIIVSNGCDSDDYRTATIAIAQKYGIPYIDMNGDKQTPCMIRSTNASIDSSVRNQRTANWRVSNDNGHPNAACHAFEATFIENFLRSL